MKDERICHWFDVCPLKRFFEEGKLDRKWVEDYCFSNNPNCVRKKMEENGEYHPDSMLPDGTIDGNLK